MERKITIVMCEFLGDDQFSGPIDTSTLSKGLRKRIAEAVDDEVRGEFFEESDFEELHNSWNNHGCMIKPPVTISGYICTANPF